MNNIDKAYTELLQDIIDNGYTKADRTNTGTISVFGRQIRHKMSEGFPLLTTKKMHWKSIVTELLWFLRGDTNIKYLVDNGCNIWTGDAYKNYESKQQTNYYIPTYSQEDFINKIKTDDEFAEKWGELGPIYGKQWRSWETNAISRRSSGTVNESGVVENMTFIEDSQLTIDQIANLINDLKTNPDSRRLMVNAWNVGELDQMVLPPCHYGFQVYTRELSLEDRLLLADKINKEIRQDLYSYAFNNPIYTGGIDQRPDDVERHHLLNDSNIPTRAISLMYNTRSQDVPLGTPFNIASYALLLEIIAKEVNMVPDELIANMGDCHIYLNQKEGVVEQLTREPYELPTVKISDRVVNDISEYTLDDIILENYQSHPAIKMPLSN